MVGILRRIWSNKILIHKKFKSISTVQTFSMLIKSCIVLKADESCTRTLFSPVGRRAAAAVLVWALGTAALSSPGREERRRPRETNSVQQNIPSRSSARRNTKQEKVNKLNFFMTLWWKKGVSYCWTVISTHDSVPSLSLTIHGNQRRNVRRGWSSALL